MCDLIKLFKEFGYKLQSENDKEIVFISEVENSKVFTITKESGRYYVSFPLKNSNYNFQTYFNNGYELFEYIQGKLNYLE